MQNVPRIEAVILAAGESSRFGSTPKQLAKINGTYLLDSVIAAAVKAGFAKPNVVLGAYQQEITRKSKMLEKCRTIYNPHWPNGMSTSITTALASIDADSAGAVFLLADQPLLSSTLLQEMTDKFIDKKPDVLYPEYKGMRGNPVIISSKIFPRLMEITGDTGGRFLFQRDDIALYRFTTDEQSCILDIDTADDLEQVRSLINNLC